MPDTILHKTRGVHSFLGDPEKISVKVRQVGVRNFELSGTSAYVVAGDLILKWSDDGTVKTVHRIMAVSPIKPGEYMGSMRDLKYFNELNQVDIEAIRRMEAHLASLQRRVQG